MVEIELFTSLHHVHIILYRVFKGDSLFNPHFSFTAEQDLFSHNFHCRPSFSRKLQLINYKQLNKFFSFPEKLY
jgi:hypothetical protein